MPEAKVKSENKIAFKEWAVVVNALAQGKQILILRKGGIHEDSGEFKIEHDEFFLFPTYEHQNPSDLKPASHPDLAALMRTKPEPDEFPIRYYAKVIGIAHFDAENSLKQLAPYHLWSDEAINKRFVYGKQKGLYVIAVRVFILPIPHLITVTPEYAGCKSWVSLDRGLSTEGAAPVLSDAQFSEEWNKIHHFFK